MKKLILSFLSVILVSIGLRAQVTSGAISGNVRDNKNEPVMGAVIKITHVPSGTIYGGKSRANGAFEVRGLRVGGPYKVEASSLGSGKDLIENVYVDLGDPTNVSIQLEGATNKIKEVFVTSSRNSVINSDKTGASTNINSQLINAMPSGSRSLTDMTRLSPQAGVSFSSSTLNNGNSFGGRDGRYNNLQVNGANLNNGFGLTTSMTPGGASQPISLDAIEEIQVGVSPFDVRQTGFTGANINAVTRSGTNEIKGSVYSFYKSNGLVGDMVDTVNLDVAKNSNLIMGARLGAPIIKDKLFIFGNFEYEKNIFPGNTWALAGSGITGNVNTGTPMDSLTRFSNHLSQTYGYQTGAYQGYGDFKNENNKLLLRLDWNVNEKNKFNISFSNMYGYEDQLVNRTSSGAGANAVSNARVGTNSMSFQNSNYAFDRYVRSLAAELNSTLNPIMSNQLLATYSFIQDQRSTPGSVFPFIDITRGGTNNYMSAGSELFSYKNDIKNTNFIVTDNLTIDLKANQLTVGASYEYSLFENSFLSGGNLYYRYNSLNDFITNARPSIFAVTYPLAAQNGNTYAKASFGQLGFYLQDKFSVSKRFTLTGGIRFDIPMYDNSLLIPNTGVDNLTFRDVDGSALKFRSGSFPSSQLMVSPRAAFNWDVNGDKTVQVRGGLGVFTGRIPFVWMTNQTSGIGTITTNALYNTTAQINSNNIRFYQDLAQLQKDNPALWNSMPQNTSTAPRTIAMVDANFKMPQVLRASAAVDYKLPWYGLIATAEMMATRDIISVMQYNAALPPAQSVNTAAGDGRPRWTSTTIAGVPTGTQAFMLTNAPVQGYSTVASIGVQRTARRGFFGSLFATRTWSEDISSNPGSQAASAWNGLPNTSNPNDIALAVSQYNTPFRLVGSLSYKFEYAKKKLATTVSLYYEGANPGRYSYMYSGDMNGDGVNQDLIYIPNSSAEINFVPITGAGGTVSVQNQRDIWDAYVAQDEYLSANKGKKAGRYDATYPWYSRIDLRLLQDFNFNIKEKKQTFQFSLDVINLPNLINSAWGVQKQLSIGGLSNDNRVLRTVTSGANPTYQLMMDASSSEALTNSRAAYSSTFVNNNSIFSTWYMQVGLRYIF